jgi:hypothetical protein
VSRSMGFVAATSATNPIDVGQAGAVIVMSVRTRTARGSGREIVNWRKPDSYFLLNDLGCRNSKTRDSPVRVDLFQD